MRSTLFSYRTGLCGIALLCILNAWSQSIEIRATEVPITIDGVIDERWNLADSAYDFKQYFPFDSSLAEAQTVAKILYDDEFIYLLGVMQNRSKDRSYITTSLRRDFRGPSNDSFSVIFDPFKDHTNGTLFGINPFGVRREGLITNGGSGQGAFSLDWDNKWFGEAKQYEGYWVAEMAIPFSTLRFPKGADSWYVNFYRVDSENVERSTWSEVPRIFSIVNMANHRTMYWDRPKENRGVNASVIPYVSAGTTKDFEEGTPSDESLQAGVDLKYAITSGLNLDVTVNPDFSQVEVDRQVTNLDRFEIFFPERRQFFLENADLFSNFGNRGTRPFFSRRIGVAVDTATGQNVQNRIPGGVRLSGKINDDLRLGVLSMQAAADDDINLPSYNFTVVTAQQKVFTRSNVNFLMVNRETFDDESEFDTTTFSAYNRVFGVDYNLASANNRWNGRAFIHRSFEQDEGNEPFASGMFLNYRDYKWSVDVFSQYVGDGYNPAAGFVRRTNIRQLASTTTYRWFPEGSPIQSHGPGFDFDMVRNASDGFLDWDVNLLYNITFRNNAEYRMRLRRQYTFLLNSFDPSGSDGVELEAGTEYYNYQFIMSFNSDQRKKLFYQLRTRSGQFFAGERWNLQGTVSYRYQPLGFASLDFAFNRIVQPEPLTTTNLYLFGPRFDFTFTRSFFVTAFFQYNSQLENVNINTRLQWRFQPVSDLFLVYTDNYFATQEGGFINFGAPRTRALTFKMTYWFNL